MMSPSDDLEVRLDHYCKCKQVVAMREAQLGYGSDGSVWRTTRLTAIKVFHRQHTHAIEVECYRRLASQSVYRIGRFNVPQMLDHDDQLLVIELTIVQPPYLLDFGKVELDIDPVLRYGEQVIRQQEAQWRSYFADDWPQVTEALYELRVRHGIYYLDPRPGNIDTGRDELTDDWLREPEIDYDNYS